MYSKYCPIILPFGVYLFWSVESRTIFKIDGYPLSILHLKLYLGQIMLKHQPYFSSFPPNFFLEFNKCVQSNVLWTSAACNYFISFASVKYCFNFSKLWACVSILFHTIFGFNFNISYKFLPCLFLQTSVSQPCV